MKTQFLTGFLAVALAGTLSAAAAAKIQTRNDGVKDAADLTAMTISGVIWDVERNRPGIRIKPWEIEIVRYTGSSMDSFNGLPRKLSGGRGDRLIEDANSYINSEMNAGFGDDQWNRDIILSCKYFLAMGGFLNGNYTDAISGLESYIKEAESQIFDERDTLSNVSFESKVSGKRVSNAGGLNIHYLDALQSLAMAYLRDGDAKKANDRALAPLQELCESLYDSGRDKEYYDWALDTLREFANFAEDNEDYKGAREAYDQISKIALKKEGGRVSLAAHEASLKVGFMLIKEGDTRSARARFYVAIKNWEDAAVDPDRLDRASPPERDWMSPDVAYLTSGSFTGQGMALAKEADRKEDWTEAYANLSTALSIFSGNDEIRSMALLGAANACAHLAELAEDAVAGVYAKLAEKYLSELTTLLPKTKAADDASIPEIEKMIAPFLKEEE